MSSLGWPARALLLALLPGVAVAVPAATPTASSSAPAPPISPPSSSSAPSAPTPAPRVTRVLVHKGARSMDLFDGDKLVRSYAVAVGRGGPGPKQREGDKVTPVGRYRVLKHMPSHLRIFMLIDYPNAEDRARFAKLKA